MTWPPSIRTPMSGPISLYPSPRADCFSGDLPALTPREETLIVTEETTPLMGSISAPADYAWPKLHHKDYGRSVDEPDTPRDPRNVTRRNCGCCETCLDCTIKGLYRFIFTACCFCFSEMDKP